MSTATHLTTGLAYDDVGTGTPVVFLHGLTFDRRTWQPIVERLDGSVRSIAIDLPAHGESGGAPAPLELLVDQIHDLLVSLGVERPLVVGHSMGGGLAFYYSAAHPTAGFVVVEPGDPYAFAELVRGLEPVLRGPAFGDAWQRFEDSLGIERIPEPARSLVLDSHVVHQDVVVGYWEPLMRSDPVELQASVDAVIPRLDVPCLAVYGRRLTDAERELYDRLPDFQLEEWTGDGHCVHLVDLDRFAARLAQFVDHCAAG
jgi:pimeloyl-ACP methyl ester carboxylesterase